MIRLLILIVILTGFSSVISPVYSQLDAINLTKYSETDGNNVYDVISDKYGFIWIATENGLLRFDGYEFTRFYQDPNDPTSISQISTHSLLEDKKGRIWVGGLQDINVYHPSTGSFTSYPFVHLLGITEQELPMVVTITENSNGTIYFGVESGYGIPIDEGLLYYNETTNSIEKVPNLRPLEVNAISFSTSDASGNSWFTGRGKFIKIDVNGNVENVVFPAIPPDRRNINMEIHSDREGFIWTAFERYMLHRYNPQTKTYQEYRLQDFTGNEQDETLILKIQTDPTNRLLLGTSKGLFMFDEATALLTGFPEHSGNSFEKSIIISLDLDDFGNIWMGSMSNGLLKYEEKSYFRSVKSSLNPGSEITPGWVNVLFEAPEGTVWISTGGFGGESGLNKLDLETGVISKYSFLQLGVNLYGITDIDSLSNFNLMLSTYGGQIDLDTKSMDIEPIKSLSIPDSLEWINRFHKDQYDTEWLATSFGLYSKRKGQTEYTFHDLSKLENGTPISNEVMQIVESDLHGLWFLTNFGLFSADAQTGKIRRHGNDLAAGDVFISQDINSLFDDGEGTVWVGTWQGGLSRYHPRTGKIKTYTRRDGLPSMAIQYILHDPGENDLWLSTFEGITRFNIPTEEFINFTTEDGIHSQLFSDGSGLKTEDGHFMFGGSGGYTLFKPEDIIQKSIPPAVNLTAFSVSNQELEFENGIQNTERIELKHNENTISIGFAAIHYSNPNRNKVKYILRNYDLDWHQSGNQNFAYYSGLPPGTYFFEVMAANSKGTWSTEGAKLEIQILSPWWRTWTAYGFYTIFFIAGVFSVDQYQRKRLLEKERRKTREKELKQAKEIEKAYRNLEVAHEKLKAAQKQLVQQEKLASLGQLTAGIAHEIKNPLNFVTNFSDVSLEIIEEALEEINHIESNEHANEVKELLRDIQTNLTKIHQHGTRADTIVTSMLQHSRGGSGKMEPTDVNALIREYINLAYHGMRAGKEPIAVELNFELDEDLGNVNIISDDFSRVLINLAKNAFDAMREKARTATDYSPVLNVQSKRRGDTVEISIEDNGPGIPEDIKDKILDPFFTTKKGTEGTGLGLSITHDIIKAHGGELEVETSKNKGAVFTVRINSPIPEVKKPEVKMTN
jgi:signal transduction histidine kinase/ligand-binding sensor domain-containing protein